VSPLAWIGVLLLSFVGAGAAFLLVYFFWMRRFSRRLFEMQVMLYKVTALFQKAQKARSPQTARKTSTRRTEATGATPPPGAVPRITISVEGRSVEIVEVEGREVVRVEGDDLTDAQRSRILAYLRDEGFIS
jgi:hypothetical protein